MKCNRKVLLFLLVAVLIGCSGIGDVAHPIDFQVEQRHITAPEVIPAEQIPEIVTSLPVITAPQPEAPQELYSVVVQDVPVRELLFAMARDADINIDVPATISGAVSINAIDQTLPQILSRISRQVPIRWNFERSNYLVVEADLPYFRNYRIDYVNVTRNTASEVSVSSAILGTVGDGGGGTEANNSTTLLTQVSTNQFWESMRGNLMSILGENVSDGSDAASNSIIVSPESGLVAVRATERQHREISAFIDSVRTRSLYQVMIEATVVEVTLDDRFQSGVDWSLVARDSGQVSFSQDVTGLNLNGSPANVLTIDKSAGPDAITSTIRLLSQFGEIKVLSSPRMMALNNQTALLRVVDSRVFFTIDVEAGFPGTATSPAIPPTFTSEVHTVPVGFTMAVTPQISENDEVTLNVRPTITRILRFVDDPNPALADANVINSIPELQIREIESILKVDSGQIAVLGGLMQDTIDNNNAGLPGLNRIPIVGDAFSYRDDQTTKTELIIFIRPVVIRNADINGDLRDYGEFLPTSSFGIPQNNPLFIN